MTAWEPDGAERIRCTRHSVTFGRLDHCVACVADPPPPEPDEAEVAITSPAGCIASDEIERRAVEVMDEVMTSLRSLRATPAKKPNLGLWQTIAKLTDVWLKAARLAGEYTAIRERRAHVKRLELRERQMGRGTKGKRRAK